MNFSKAHLSAIIAYSLWGLFPLYWKIFPEVSAWDLFAHRLCWSFISLIILLTYKKNLIVIKKIWFSRKIRNMLILSAIFISSNWLLYIYAVNEGKVLEASMGYFLNPLINVFMGWMILKEKVRLTQWPSLILAFISIVLIALQTNLENFPWIAITLSLTFALYGLIRKLAHVGALEGLSFETCFMIVPVLLFWPSQGTTPLTAVHLIPSWKFALLTLSGFVTCVPLVLFAYSARNLPLKTLGFIGYLSPSLKFICGLFILGEILTPEKLQAFSLIWLALIWYTVESYFFIKKEKSKTEMIITE